MKFQNSMKSIVSQTAFLLLLLFIAGNCLAQQDANESDSYYRITPQNEWYQKANVGFLIEEPVGVEEHFKSLVNDGGVDWVTVACEISGAVFYPSKLPAQTILPNLKMDYMRFTRDLADKYGIKYLSGFYGFRHSYAGRKHPEWKVIGADGEPSRNLFCPNTRFTEDLMLAQIREVYQMYKPDGYWFDCDNWIVGPCYCENCLRLFKEQYGIDAPRSPEDPNWPKYTEFRRWSFRNYQKKVANLIHDLNPNNAYVSNWGYTFLQPEPTPEFVDFLSSDIGGGRRTEMVSFLAHYHDAESVPWDIMLSDWFSATRGWRTEDFRPKSPEYYKQEYAVVAAHGGRAHMWSSRDRGRGRATDDYIPPYDINLARELSNFLDSRESVFKNNEPVRHVAVLHSASTFYKDGSGFFNHNGALDRIAGANLALRQNHVHFQILNEEYLSESLDDYRVVVLSNQSNLSAELINKLRRWVDKGGSLIATGLTATETNASGERKMLLADVLGVDFDDADVINPGILRMSKIPFHASLVTDFYPVWPRGARVLEPLMKDWNPYNLDTMPYPAVTVHQFGKGKGIYIAADIFSRYWNFQYPGILRILDKVMRAADPEPQIETDAPRFITFVLKKKGKNLITHIVNENVDGDMSMPESIFVENIPAYGPVTVKIRCDRQPVNVYSVPDIGKVNWRWDKDGVWVTVPSVHIHQALVFQNAVE